MKDESGFSLLEVVISIAALTLISGFILQMFIASIYLNRKAYNLDRGVNAAAQALETFKGGHMPDDGDNLMQYFDGDWNQITVEKPDEHGFTLDDLFLPDNVAFILTMNATEDGIYENEVYTAFDSNGGRTAVTEQTKMYRIDAVVYEINERSHKEKIAGLSTRKYR